MYYPFFDWLRISLAITVALVHGGIGFWPHLGNLAVQVFFALSGWLIGGILLNSKYGELPRFFFNRVTRIWVPYTVAIVLLVCASLLKEQITLKWLEFVFYKVTFVYNLFGPPQLATFKTEMPLDGTGNHFWTICAEEQFYLFAPLLILVLPARFGKSTLLWGMISFFAISYDYYGAIVLGVWAAVIKQNISNRYFDKNFRPFLLGIIFFAAALMYIYDSWYVTIAPIFSISLVLFLARLGNRSKWGQFWGGVSYPFYLNHWIGVFFAHAVLDPFGLRESEITIVVALLTNLIVASILYMLVDQRIIKYRSQWFTSCRGNIASITAYSLLFIGLIGGVLFRVFLVI